LKLLSKPPRIKVLEAIGCIGDERIRVLNDREARVVSSTGDREYRVYVVEMGGEYRVYSDDNGTIFKGYVGYPIIAFLMLKNVIPVDLHVMKAMTGVPWKRLNERYKKYSVVENIVLDRAERMGVSRDVINDYVNIVMKKLDFLKIYLDENIVKELSSLS